MNMNRRNFLRTTALATAGSSLAFAFGRGRFGFLPDETIKLSDLAAVSPQLEASFQQLLQWLSTNGWTNYLSKELGIDLSLQGDALKAELIKELDSEKLQAIRSKEGSGYDDFSGSRLVQPGFPAFSLLYHTLASPRVRASEFAAYPELKQIDILENYIHALYAFSKLKSDYDIASDKDLVLAVFAYEYRPAFKTPHHQHADIVYSRTGIARIGTEPINYDAINRCFTNNPADAAKTKLVAVTPARYGVFIAKKVRSNRVDLMKADTSKPGDPYNDAKDGEKWFLQPVRKLFNDDLLTNGSKIDFTELHRSEKIYKLHVTKKLPITGGLIPPVLDSAYLLMQDESRNAGSSFLVISIPRPLIRHALKDGQPLYFKVNKGTEDTRYFNSLNTQAVEDVELLQLNPQTKNGTYWHSVNYYDAPRKQPLFLNITHQKSGQSYTQLKREMNGSFDKKINAGAYDSPLFEDSICDGQVSVNTAGIDFAKLGTISKLCLPAFSIVTAPDFFPQVDCFDMLAYDIAPGRNKKDTNFYEGGTASLATLRMRPNPRVLDTKDPTYTAVLSKQSKKIPGISKEKLDTFQNPSVDKGYFVSGFLPDVSSSIFAPGWDITYSGTKDNIYLATEGLGSPFTEDMKLCAAMNGMWPAASPDAARTYQGGLEPEYRNTTAVPLMDDEIGLHADSPGGAGEHSYGWDGEQGPYIEKINGKWKVNFTDLARADVVQNTLDATLDMSKLRELTSKELISRMDCLRACIQKLPKKNFESKEKLAKMTGFTYHWLVSAEKANWGNEDVKAAGIPENLAGSKDWISNKMNAKVNGPGYLFVFIDTSKDDLDHRDWADYKRRRLTIDNLYVCQVTEKGIAWKEMMRGSKKDWQF
ncbi:MAG: twin-arginine translocation signal domain-containing protein [Bacteroidota bacterium]